MKTYLEFGARAAEVKNELLTLLIQLKREGKRVIGYGAPGKGNTLVELLRHQDRFVAINLRQEPAQARPVLPGLTYTYFPARAHR